MFDELLSEARHRLRAVFRRAAVEREIEEELRFHLACETEKHRRAGATPEEAARLAHASFGGVYRARRATRDAKGVAVLDAVTQDVRYALRGLRRTPGLTLAVVLTLALGIGATTALFGAVDRLLLRPPAYLRDPATVDRVYLASTQRGTETLDHHIEYRRYLDLAEATPSLAAVAAFHLIETPIGDGDDVREVRVGAASASFFDFFDARPAAGRFFDARDDALPAGAMVVVLDHAYWQAAYGGRRDAIGSQLRIGPASFTIIGVAPPGFAGVATGRGPVAWIPITTYAAAIYPGTFFIGYNWGWLEMLVRRKPGVGVEQATTELTAAYRRSWRAERALFPGLTPPETARPHVILAPTQLGRGPQAGPEGRVVAWVGGVALVVLVIACANVANLLLARAFRRRREIALRLAMGVARGRLVAQLLTEGVALALLGGAAALLVARVAGAALGALLAGRGAGDDVPSTSLADGRVLAFALAVTLVVGVLTGLAPALYAGRDDLVAALKAGAREGNRRRSRARTLLVVLQGALSVVLLVGAGLFVRSVTNVRAMRLGYDVDPVLFVRASMRGVKLDDAARRALGARLVAAAEAIPGVVAASEVRSTPFYNHESAGLWVPGIDSVARLGRFQQQVAGPHYFRAFGTRILAGRAFTAADRRGTPPVLVVSATMASRLWPGKDPLGQCVRVGADTAPCATVVGVAEDIKERELSARTTEAHYYLPVDQTSRPTAGLYVRVDGRARDHAETVRKRLQQAMPGASYVVALPFADIVGGEQRSWVIGATMFAALGALALLVAAIGMYSVIAYDVAQRTREMGVRVALGARARDVVRLVLGEGVRFAVTGVALGALLALAAGRWAAPLLFEVSPHDPAVFGTVAAVLLGVALLASTLPALRALRADPSRALRTE